MSRTTLRIFFISCIAVLLSAFSSDISHAASPLYNVIDLGALGGTYSESNGINASGQVTGFFRTGSTDHAFLYDGTMHDLGTLGGTSSQGKAINDNGQVTGYARTASNVANVFLYDGTMHDLGIRGVGWDINNSGHISGGSTAVVSGGLAFLYDGTMHDLGTLGGSFSDAHGINDSGIIVGHSWGSTGPFDRAFLYDGTMHDLGTLGGSGADAFAINNNGQVTGTAGITGDSTFHAFLYDGMMHDLGGTESVGWGINDNGNVVGTSNFNNLTNRRAFVYDSLNGMRDLNTLISPSSGWLLREAKGINDNGWITGYGIIGTQTHAFILTPIPEPATSAMFILAGVGIIWRARRKSNKRQIVNSTTSLIDKSLHSAREEGYLFIQLQRFYFKIY